MRSLLRGGLPSVECRSDGKHCRVADDTTAQKMRRAYGRGYYDAINSLGNGSMTPARAQEAEKSLNGMARKVLDAVPLTEQWTVADIMLEMKRLGTGTPDHRVVLGCLGSLKAMKLVKEDDQKFQRVKAKPIIRVVPSAPERKDEDKVQPAQEKDTLQRMADLSADIRKASASLSAFATQLDDIALDVESRIQAVGQQGEKLRTLQRLLREIGSDQGA